MRKAAHLLPDSSTHGDATIDQRTVHRQNFTSLVHSTPAEMVITSQDKHYKTIGSKQQQHKLFGSHSQIRSFPVKGKKEKCRQHSVYLLYKELADYIAKLQPQGWCLHVAFGHARHVPPSSVTSLPQHYPSKLNGTKLCLSSVRYQQRSKQKNNQQQIEQQHAKIQ